MDSSFNTLDSEAFCEALKNNYVSYNPIERFASLNQLVLGVDVYRAYMEETALSLLSNMEKLVSWKLRLRKPNPTDAEDRRVRRSILRRPVKIVCNGFVITISKTSGE